MSTIDISRLRVNGGTQSRAEINRDVVSDYAELVSAGIVFPPVIVFFDGSEYWLADGFHRYEAYAKAGVYEIPADVRQGGQRDAILFSVGANAAHGLRRTNDDKKRAVMVLLNDPEWSRWSDREIARQCGVSPDTVGRYRKMPSNVTVRSDSEPRTYTTRHGTTATMNTANIGGGSKPDQIPQPPAPKPQPADDEPISPQPEPGPDADPVHESKPDQKPDAAADIAKVKKQLAKLTDDALFDEIIGLRADNDDLRKQITAVEAERDELKAAVRDLSESNQGAVISRMKRELVSVKFARDEALAAAKREEYKRKQAEARVNELQSAGFEIAV
ncbi:hypothetical protein FHS82_001026 [Pseudochelatococcus lubricantis]|uniref:ParB-like N-terminal domain-containing protein n=1 Tax=Pseudochelatococcus lubricantis TaxID=1538102 RepID=A0ABX0UZ26_9HYPH|nr:ParB N-terminal domain-containing protein [Pseudochelatococcus lubricantis]NIJ57200.1 hypothetical protein [Pseudochelatococcus lubricantis]